MIKEWIKNFLNQPKVKDLIHDAQVRLEPVILYWERLTPRDQQLLSGVGIIVALSIIFLVISSAMDLTSNLKDDYATTKQYRLDGEVMAKQYKELSQVTSNNFSSVSNEKINSDVTQVLGVKNPQVLLSDNTLTIIVDNAKFELVMLLLDQLRKSYGLFPTKLKITRLSEADSVSFNATFVIENK